MAQHREGKKHWPHDDDDDDDDGDDDDDDANASSLFMAGQPNPPPNVTPSEIRVSWGLYSRKLI